MSKKSNSTVTTMRIDIGKNSFHVVELDQRGAIVLRQKWSAQIEARQHAALPDWHGSLRWRTSPEPEAPSARSRCATDATAANQPTT
jgi:hypothetical protein